MPGIRLRPESRVQPASRGLQRIWRADEESVSTGILCTPLDRNPVYTPDFVAYRAQIASVVACRSLAMFIRLIV